MIKKLTIIALWAIYGTTKAFAQDPAPTSPTAISPNFTWYKKITGADTSYYGYSNNNWVNLARRNWVKQQLVAYALDANTLKLSGVTNQRIYGNIGANSVISFNGADFSTLQGTAWSHPSGNTINIYDGPGHNSIYYYASNSHRFQSEGKYISIAGNTITNSLGDTAIFSNSNLFTHNTGSETISGSKTFTSPIYIPGHQSGIELDNLVIKSIASAATINAKDRNGINIQGLSGKIIASFNDANTTADNPYIRLYFGLFLDHNIPTAYSTTYVLGKDSAGRHMVQYPKNYFAVAANYLPLAGGTLTGPIYLNNDAVYATQPITKNQFDNFSTGLSWKQEARVKTISNIILADTPIIDGISLVLNDRILVTNQINASENGLYTVKSGAWIRSTDADSPSEIAATTILIRLGNTNKNTLWTCDNTTAPTIGTDAITFRQMAGSGTYTNGSGINLNGNAFEIDYSALDTRYVTQSGSFADPDWLSSLSYGKINSIPSHSILGNTTGSTSTASAITYFDSGEQNYTGNVSWTGTSAPSGTPTSSYRWTQVGKMVTIRITIVYPTGGTALTQLEADVPTDVPLPAPPASFSTSDITYQGWGGVSTSKSDSLVQPGSVSIIEQSGTWKFKMESTATNTSVAHLNYVYYTL
jgi:hypothetical protein